MRELTVNQQVVRYAAFDNPGVFCIHADTGLERGAPNPTCIEMAVYCNNSGGYVEVSAYRDEMYLINASYTSATKRRWQYNRHAFAKTWMEAYLAAVGLIRQLERVRLRVQTMPADDRGYDGRAAVAELLPLEVNNETH